MLKALRSALIGAILLAASAAPAPAQVVQEALDYGVVEQIRDEGFNRSQVEDVIGYLTDVIGPRLTGSPGMKRANEWTAETLRGWGLENVQVEPWGEFGRGWERNVYSGRFLEPFVQPLNAQPVAWTGSTDGRVTGKAVIIEAQSVEEVEQYRGQLEDAFILVQEPNEIGPEFDADYRRIPLDELFEAPWEPEPPTAAGVSLEELRRGRGGSSRAMEIMPAVMELARAEGAAAILNPSPWAYGILRVTGANGRDPSQPTPLPTLVVAHEQYGQIWRNAERGVPVTLEVEVQNTFYEDDLQAYNTLADIPGTDKADEYVMIGAHLDSWHTGTGATDNAAGSVIMMEAMRILKTIGVQPRRTIRMALWSGEEQGILGSRNWVQNHPELLPKISAYLNIDNGTGKLRGIWSQGNEELIPIFEQIFSPLRDLGVVITRHGETMSTDHLAFDAAGVPGLNFIQDPIEYLLRTHHSNVDTFDHLVIEDLEQAAVVVATTVYHLAMRDELLPRKTSGTTDEE